MNWVYSLWWKTESEKTEVKPNSNPKLGFCANDLVKSAEMLKKTTTTEKQMVVALQFRLATSKNNLRKPVQKKVAIVQPEFLLCRALLRPTATRKPVNILEIPSPIFLEMMEKCKKRRERLNL